MPLACLKKCFIKTQALSLNFKSIKIENSYLQKQDCWGYLESQSTNSLFLLSSTVLQRRDSLILFSLFLTLLYRNKIQKQMSFAQRLSQGQRKSSESNERSQILQNETQKINLKITRKLTEFEKHHEDLKSILQYLECEKSTRLAATPSKSNKQEHKKECQVKPQLNISIDTKQNTGNKILFKNSPQKRTKLKINKVPEQMDFFQVNKESLLLRNLKCNKKGAKQINDNPENSIQPSLKQSLLLSNTSNVIQKKGIPNIGNTCYINAVLQCLFHLKDFSEGLKAFSSARHQILERFINLYNGVMCKTVEKVDLSTLPLKKSISKMCSLFIDFHQQDAHEFLKQLLETIHQQLNRVKDKTPYKMLEPSKSKNNLSVLSQQYWNYYKKFDDSYIYDSLCGQVCNYVVCANCKYESVSFDNFLDISLPIIKGKNKLEELISEYFDEEALSDYYFCSSCKKSSKRSLKRTQLWRNPNYLIIQLKRSQFGRKNNDEIKIPVRCLNLKPYLTKIEKQSRSTMYHLQGVVLHRGVIEGGHYWAHIKDGLNWYNVDDAEVKKMDRDSFVDLYQISGSSEAYILFYKCV